MTEDPANDVIVCSIATQPADRSPNPDLRSSKFGPARPSIGLSLDLHSPLGGTCCLPSLRGARNPHKIAEMTLFFGLQSLFWSANCDEDLI